MSPEEFETRFTVVEPAVTGFPNASSRCTVSGPSVALADAVPDTGEVVNTNCDAGPGLIVNVLLVAPVNESSAAVSV